MHEAGSVARGQGRPGVARVELERALAVLRDAVPSAETVALRVRILLTMALVEFEEAGLEQAIATVRTAAAEATGLADAQLIALCRSQSSSLHGRAGLYEEAHGDMQSALRGLSMMSPRDQAELLLTNGTLQSFRQDFTAAARAFEEAERIAAAAGLPAQSFMARHNRGHVRFLQGDLPAALVLMRTADLMDVEVSRAVLRLDHGRVLLEAGLIDEAREVLRLGLDASIEDGQHQVSAELEMEGARANMLLGRHTAAEELASAASERFARRATAIWSARCRLLLLQIRGEKRDGETDPGGAPSLAQKAVELAAGPAGTVDGTVSRDAYLLAARMWLAAGEVAGAVEQLRLAGASAETVQPGSPLSSRLEQRFVVASVAAAEGKPGRAQKILEQAATDLQSDLTLGGSLDLRTAISLHAVRLADLDLHLARRMGTTAFFDAAERWRAASLRVPGVRPSSHSELADALTRLRGLEARARDGEDLWDDVKAARQQVQQIARGRAARAERDPHAVTATSETTQAALTKSDSDMIQLVDHDGDLLAIALSANGIAVRVVGRSIDIASLVRRVRADLSMVAGRDLGVMGSSVRSSLRSGLRRLDEMLVVPNERGRRRLVLVTSASTRALPWPMLPSLVGVPITVAQSATQWLRGLQGRVSPRRSVPRVTTVAGPGLTHAADEAQTISRLWRQPDGKLAGPAASADALKGALAGSDVVHIAAHGTHERQNPMFAQLRLHDGPLYVHDLELEGVSAAHVVLSACDVGASTTRPGEEVLGLAAGLLALGAVSVLAAVCRVGDEVAAQTMTRYHHHLAAGEPSDIALAHAVADGPPLAGAFGVFGSPWQAPVPN